MGAVMGEGGGVIGSRRHEHPRALSDRHDTQGHARPLGVRERRRRPPVVGPLGRRRDGAHDRLPAELDAGAAGRVRLRHRQRRAPARARADPPGPLRPGRVRRPADARGPRRRSSASTWPGAARDPEAFDLEELAAASDGFSGAEIEAAVKGALLDALHGRRARADDRRRAAARARPSGRRPRSSARRSRSCAGGRGSTWPSTPCAAGGREPASACWSSRRSVGLVSKYLASPRSSSRTGGCCWPRSPTSATPRSRTGKTCRCTATSGDRRPETAGLVVRRRAHRLAPPTTWASSARPTATCRS